MFVCYAHADSETVYPELDWIHQQDIDVWYDEGISAGSNWLARIGDSLADASQVLFYISRHSLESDHCNREINYALSMGKSIIPVYLDDVELTSDLKVGLNRIQALRRDLDENYKQHLLQALAVTAEQGHQPQTSTVQDRLVVDGGTPGLTVRRQLARLPRTFWKMAVAVLVATVFGYMINVSTTPPTSLPGVVRVQFPLETWEDWKNLPGTPSMVISPDGNTVVFVARDKTGISKLKIRHLDHLGTVELAGTEGAEDPFFSPDGRWIGYFDDRVMKRVSLTSGEPPGIITSLNRHTHGASWGPDDRIYYAEHYSNLKSVSVSGGNPQDVTQLDLSRLEGSHRFPHYVADHALLLFTIYVASTRGSEIWAHDLITDERVYLFDGLAPTYIDSGHIVYAKAQRGGRGGSLWAVPFDPTSRALTGRPQLIRDAVAGVRGTAYAVASSGKLIYLPKQGESVAELVLLEPGGPRILATAQGFEAPTFSNDGKKIAVVAYEAGKSPSIRIYDIESGIVRQFADGRHPLWDPGDQWITFIRQGIGLVRQRLDGSEAVETLVQHEGAIIPDTRINQGRTFVYHVFGEDGSSNTAHAYALEAAGEARRIVGDDAAYLSFTRDERWVAYSTWPRGVLVAPFTDNAIAVDATISGHTSKWGDNDSRLYYQDFNKLWAVDVDLTQGIAFGNREPIADFGHPGLQLYDIREDQIVIVRHRDLDPKPPVLVMNWDRVLDDAD